MPEPTYAEAANRFIADVLIEIDAATNLARLLEAHDDSLTLAEWRETDPVTAVMADELAEQIGFDLPNTDDYVWQAVDALNDHLIQTAGYGFDVHKIVRITLAGGGPAGWIDFTLDGGGELRGAAVSYCDWWQTPVTRELTVDEAAAAYDRYRVELIAYSPA